MTLTRGFLVAKLAKNDFLVPYNPLINHALTEVSLQY